MRPTSRRSVLAASALLPVAALPAFGQADWRAKFPEIRFGISSSENERDSIARHEPFAAYMTERMGVPVRVFRATDYAAVVEALRSKNAEFARIGPANYALAYRLMGAGIAPVLITRDADGATGYRSVIVVRADSAARTVADLQGRSLAFADPNSTSGYAFPMFYLRKEGIDPAKHFARTGFSGSHELGVIAVVNGAYDAAATHWTSANRGNVQRMEEKGMVPKGSTRIVWTSPSIPNSPHVVRTDLPDAMRALWVASLMAMPTEGRAAWDALESGQEPAQDLVSAKHEDFLDVIAVVEENQRNRRARGS